MGFDSTMSRLAIVRKSDRRVVTFVRSDVPEGWLAPEGCVAVREDTLPPDWQMADAIRVVPGSVTPYQFRVWCVTHGISMAQIDALIAAIPDEQERAVAQVAWEYGLVVERSHPLIGTFAAALGLTAEQVDAAFIEAAAL